MKITKLKARSNSTAILISIAQIVLGTMAGGISGGFYMLSRFFEERLRPDVNVASSIFFLLLFFSVLLIIRGISNCVVYNRYRKISKAVISRGGEVSLRQIADELVTSPAKILKDIELTMSRRYWSGYSCNESTLFLVDYENNSGSVLSAPGMVFKTGLKRSRDCIWAFITVWVVSAVFGILSMGYGIGALVTLAVAVITMLVWAQILPRQIGFEEKTQKIPQEKPVEKNEPKEEQSEADIVLGEGLGYLKELEALDSTINDEKLDKPVRELYDISSQILGIVQKSPEKTKQIKQFIRYYLPTTIKLLNNYYELNSQPVKGDNINESIKKIEGIMDGLLLTFRNQLDDLYRDKSIDISADVSVMENMIGQGNTLLGKTEK